MTTAVNFEKCIIPWMTFSPFGKATWTNRYSNCTVTGPINLAAISTGTFFGTDIRFEGCTITPGPTFTIQLNGNEGTIKFVNCLFPCASGVGNAFNIYMYGDGSHPLTTTMFSNSTIIFDSCIFAPDSTSYGLSITTNTPAVLNTFKNLLLTNCKFTTGYAVNNACVANLKMSNCVMENGTITNAAGCYTDLTNCIGAVTSTAPKSFYYLPIKIKDQVVPSCTFRASLYSSFIADYTAAVAGGAGGTIAGHATIVNNGLRIGNDASNQFQWTVDGNVDGGQTGTIKFKYKPEFTISGGTRYIINMSKNDGTNNIGLKYNFNSSDVVLFVSSPVASETASATITGTPFVSGTEYEVAISWNLVTPQVLCLINGAVAATISTCPGAGRVAGQVLYLQVAAAYANYKDIMVFNTQLYTGPYTTGYNALNSLYAPKVNVEYVADTSQTTTLSVGPTGKGSITSSGAEFDFPASDVARVLNTTDSAGINLGAFSVAGGMSCQKKLHSGDAMTIHAAADVTKAVTFTVTSVGGVGVLSASLSGIPIFASQEAAVTGNLTAGMIYRSGANPDVLSIVH